MQRCAVNTMGKQANDWESKPIMSTKPTLRSALVAKIPQLRPSEKQVATFMLNNESTFPELSLRSLAESACVSEATVLRLCSEVAGTGLRAFRLRWVREMGDQGEGRAQKHAEPSAFLGVAEVSAQPPERLRDVGIGPNDSIEQILTKVFDGACQTLQSIRQEIGAEVIAQSISILDNAESVAIFAYGGSVPTAMDTQHKLFRLGILSSTYSDPHLQHMAAVSLQPGDAVIAISNSGTTKALIDSVRLVRELHPSTAVIGLTPQGTQLAELATVRLCIESDERGVMMQPLFSRLGYQTIMDAVITGVAQLRGDSAQKHLNSVNRSQDRLRL